MRYLLLLSLTACLQADPTPIADAKARCRQARGIWVYDFEAHRLSDTAIIRPIKDQGVYRTYYNCLQPVPGYDPPPPAPEARP